MKDAKAQRLARGALALQSKHARRTGGLSIVSRVAANFGASTSNLTAGTNNTSRIRHQNLTGGKVLSLCPVYAHWGPSSSTESQTPGDWTVKPSIEPEGTASDQSAPIRMAASGRRPFQLDRRAVVVTDEIDYLIEPAAYFYERCEYSSASGTIAVGRHQIARGGTATWGVDTGEGADSSQSRADAGTITNNTSSAYSASLMLGRTLSGLITTSIVIVGDSKAVGSHDAGFGPNAGGWASRACANFAGGNLAIAGEKLSQAIVPTNFMTRFAISKFATHILCEYLTNDVLNGDSVATMKASVLAFAYKFMSRGQNFIQATVPPLTDSSGGWRTVGDQTVRANEANRTGINDWIRDTSATGFAAQAIAAVAAIPDAGWADFIDPCLGIEVNGSNVLTLNGGFVKQPTATTDTGTATSGAAGTITNSGKSYTVNGLKGLVVYTTGGTGAGQVASITHNTATVISVTPSWAVTPDNTTTYEIYDGNSVDGTHESTAGHTLVAASVEPKLTTLMARP
jgi:lysophospholipase L1-like esterase